MDTVVYDRIEDVLGRIESLYGRVEDTYLVAKDILMGTQISDWIADIKASGTASATYQDASRMNALIANEDAANNQDVAKYLVQWAVANNKFGTYCGAACGAVSGVTWDSLTTPNAVMSNATAFTALWNSSVAYTEIMNNYNTKRAIWDCSAVTEPVISNHPVILAKLQTFSKKTSQTEGPNDVQFFIFSVGSIVYSPTATLEFKNGGSQVYEIKEGQTYEVNKFVTRTSHDETSRAALNCNIINFKV